MRRSVIVCAALAAMVGVGTLVSAQTRPGGVTSSASSAAAKVDAAPDAGTLTLQQCLDLAMKNSHRRAAAASSVEIAKAQQGQAASANYPSLNATFSATRMNANPNFVFPASIQGVPASQFITPPMTLMLPANSFGPGVPPVNVPMTIPGQTINVPAQMYQVPAQNVELFDKSLLTLTVKAFYPLYTGGLASSRQRQAKAGVEAARQEQRQTDLDVAYDVKRAYWGVVLTHQLVTVGHDALARMEATLEITENVYKNGSGRVKKTDYLRNKAMVETIRSMVAELENQERLAGFGLEAAVEWNGATPIKVADSELRYAPADCQADSAVSQALQFSPQLGRMQAGVAAARAGIGAARSGLLPKAGLFADAHRYGNSYSYGLMTTENKRGWSVGVGFEVPLFDGFRTLHEIREAEASLLKLQQQDVLLHQAVTLDARNSCSQIAKGAAQFKASRDAHQAAVENRDLNVRAYQEDLVETKDVIEAQLMEALLAAQYYRTVYDSLDAQARLEMVTGQGTANKR
jgi:outer membrane protein